MPLVVMPEASSKITIKNRIITYIGILGMSCIIWILSLLGDEGRVQHGLSAILWIDVWARNTTLLLFREAGLVNAIDAGAREKYHVRVH
jgi:hypothetical protein